MYSRVVSESSRTSFLLLVDLSGSTMEAMSSREQGAVTKCQLLVDASNQILSQLYYLSHRGAESKDLFDIAVVAYSGDWVCSMLNNDLDNPFVSIEELSHKGAEGGDEWLQFELMSSIDSLNFAQEQSPSTIVVRPHGGTPMYEALHYVHETIERRCATSEGMRGYPPTIIHLTDGHPTDCDLESVCYISQRIMGCCVEDGATLLLNIVLADLLEPQMLFPTEEEVEESGSRFMMMMARSSSYLPHRYMPLVNRERERPTIDPCRAIMSLSAVCDMIASMEVE